MVNLSHALATLPILAKDLKLFGFAIFWLSRVYLMKVIPETCWIRYLRFYSCFVVQKIDFNHYMRFTQDCIHRLLIPVQFWFSKKKNCFIYRVMTCHAIRSVICFDLQFSRSTRQMTSFCIFIAYIKHRGNSFKLQNYKMRLKQIRLNWINPMQVKKDPFY